MAELGSTHRAIKEYAEAESCFQAAIQQSHESNTWTHDRVQLWRNELAETFLEHGRWQQALSQSVSGLLALQVRLGPNNVQVQQLNRQSPNPWANPEVGVLGSDAPLDLMERAHAELQRLAGSDSTIAVLTGLDLAYHYESHGSFATESEVRGDSFQKALSFYSSALESSIVADNSTLAVAVANRVARCLIEIDETDVAREVVAELMRGADDEESYLTYETRSLLAELDLKQKRIAEAVALMDDAHAGLFRTQQQVPQLWIGPVLGGFVQRKIALLETTAPNRADEWRIVQPWFTGQLPPPDQQTARP